jgi:uncharacterized protein YqeY
MLIEKIKHDQLVARKNRDQIESTLLTTLIGEAEMVGKNNGNRDPFDEEVISVVKKFLKGVNETIAILEKSGRDVSQFEKEREILDSYLPTQLTKEKIIVMLDSAVVDGTLVDDKSFKGAAMKWLKEHYSGQYDGRVAVEAIDEFTRK